MHNWQHYTSGVNLEKIKCTSYFPEYRLGNAGWRPTVPGKTWAAGFWPWGRPLSAAVSARLQVHPHCIFWPQPGSRIRNGGQRKHQHFMTSFNAKNLHWKPILLFPIFTGPIWGRYYDIIMLLCIWLLGPRHYLSWLRLKHAVQCPIPSCGVQEFSPNKGINFALTGRIRRLTTLNNGVHTNEYRLQQGVLLRLSSHLVCM